MKDGKIKGVYLKNFRSFKELEIKNLGDINVIVGKNNTGKSTFLEAIFLGLYPKTKFLNEEIYRSVFSSAYFLFYKRRFHLEYRHELANEEAEDLWYVIEKFFKYNPEKDAKIKLEDLNEISIFEEENMPLSDNLIEDLIRKFSRTSFIRLRRRDKDFNKLKQLMKEFFIISKHMRIKGIFDFYIVDLVDPENFFTRLRNILHRYDMYEYKEFIRFKGNGFIKYFLYKDYKEKRDKIKESESKKYMFFVEPSLIFLQKEPFFLFTKKDLLNFYSLLLKKLEKFVHEKAYETVKEKLSLFFDEEISAISPSFTDFYIYFKNKDKIPVSLIGDGTRSLIINLLALNLDRPSFLFFEEPENFMHPKMMNIFAKEVVKAGKQHQIFINTHSDEMVKYILAHSQDSNDIDIKIISFRELKDGILNYEIFDKNEAETLIFSLGEDLR